MLAAYRASGLSVTSFIRHHGLSVQRFYYWRDKIDKRPSVPESVNDMHIATTARFRRVHILPDAKAATTRVVRTTIRLRIRALRIEVASTFDESTLTKVLRAAIRAGEDGDVPA
jgi:hypothetical protein